MEDNLAIGEVDMEMNQVFIMSIGIWCTVITLKAFFIKRKDKRTCVALSLCLVAGLAVLAFGIVYPIDFIATELLLKGGTNDTYYFNLNGSGHFNFFTCLVEEKLAGRF